LDCHASRPASVTRYIRPIIGCPAATNYSHSLLVGAAEEPLRQRSSVAHSSGHGARNTRRRSRPEMMLPLGYAASAAANVGKRSTMFCDKSCSSSAAWLGGAYHPYTLYVDPPWVLWHSML